MISTELVHLLNLRIYTLYPLSSGHIVSCSNLVLISSTRLLHPLYLCIYTLLPDLQWQYCILHRSGCNDFHRARTPAKHSYSHTFTPSALTYCILCQSGCHDFHKTHTHLKPLYSHTFTLSPLIICYFAPIFFGKEKKT